MAPGPASIMSSRAALTASMTDRLLPLPPVGMHRSVAELLTAPSRWTRPTSWWRRKTPVLQPSHLQPTIDLILARRSSESGTRFGGGPRADITMVRRKGM
jgi:hypothetical protein